MTLKKHGKESSKVEEQAKEDFFTAAQMMVAVIEEFDAQDMHTGAAIGGALTQLITHLISVSPDIPAALGLLSSCITKAAYQHEGTTDIFNDDELVH